MTLPAGTYGAAQVKDGGTLILREGEYVFCKLRVSRRGSLLFAAAASIDVVGDVSFGNSTVVGPVANATVSPAISRSRSTVGA